ncbi:MAG: FmdB family zinc ribbon protein [Leptonema sp. (in: bacteria)]
MPYYDFQCEDCKTLMTVKLSVKDLENTKSVQCPNCNSVNTKRYFQPIAINHSKKEKEFMGCGQDCQCVH